jgi:hypothetical protein
MTVIKDYLGVEGKRRRKENDRGEQYRNTLCLCMKVAQGNSLKAVTNRGGEKREQ